MIVYIKSVVQGGSVTAGGRLQAGDERLKVVGQSIIGNTQKRTADYLVCTEPIVNLEVAQTGIGLETLW